MSHHPIFGNPPPIGFNPDYDPEHEKVSPLYIEKIREIHAAFRAAGITRQDTANYLHDNGWLSILWEEAKSELRAKGIYRDLKIAHRKRVINFWGIKP